MLADKAVHLFFFVKNSVFYFVEPALFDLPIELYEAQFDDVMRDLFVQPPVGGLFVLECSFIFTKKIWHFEMV